MSAEILDGRAIAAKVKAAVKKDIDARKKQGLPTPGLSVILVGDNPASATYVRHKQKACDLVGIQSQIHHLPKEVSEKDLKALIQKCNQDPNTHGILLQLPLPPHINADDLLESIRPEKDVDGFHPYNLGRLAQRRPLLRPCTPFGIMKLLDETGIDITGKHTVVVGASNIVGRPMALELLLAKSTVTVCHRFTKNLAQYVQEGEILVVAIGKPGIVQSDWIKPEAIVIDVGFSHLDNGIIAGDIDFDSAKQRASWITPVPGGVGPMTVAALMQNTLLATQLLDTINA